MRYELRQWTDSTQSEYTIKATSEDENPLTRMLEKPSIPNNEWYLLHIVDTQENS